VWLIFLIFLYCLVSMGRELPKVIDALLVFYNT
jgi:hypothetical protein